MIPVCQPANIFQHKSFWQRFPDNSHKLKQQFSPVIIKSFSQTCKTETLARRTAYDQCGLTFLYIGGFKEFFGCYIRNTFVDDGQMRIICPQCITAGRVNLYSNSNVKACVPEAYIQSPGTRKQADDRQPTLFSQFYFHND